ncbi:MAG: hypothetical protein CMJ81_04385 [Planctomycetaceae bacterium]|nr:hypothetical protein [Planctomycetaceae bacterium]
MRSVTWLLINVFVLAGCDHAAGAPQDPVAAATPAPLEVVIRHNALQDPVTAESRVPLEIVIRNVSRRPVNLPWSKFITNFIVTESTAPDGTVVAVRHTGASLGTGKYPGGDLQPSEKMVVNVWHVFPWSGQHQFKCILKTSCKQTPWFSFWEGQVESETTNVTVESR